MTQFVSMMLPAPREFQTPKLSALRIALEDIPTLFSCVRCLKTINSKKYGVDLVCFTSHPTTVIYSSRNGWDGEPNVHVHIASFIPHYLIYYFN